jgi:peptidyl-dipeptidase Dcp
MDAPDKTVANPLLQAWTAPHGLPPFKAIKPEHFVPAFEVAMREHRTSPTRWPGSTRVAG